MKMSAFSATLLLLFISLTLLANHGVAGRDLDTSSTAEQPETTGVDQAEWFRGGWGRPRPYLGFRPIPRWPHPVPRWPIPGHGGRALPPLPSWWPHHPPPAKGSKKPHPPPAKGSKNDVVSNTEQELEIGEQANDKDDGLNQGAWFYHPYEPSPRFRGWFGHPHPFPGFRRPFPGFHRPFPGWKALPPKPAHH